MPNMKNFMKTIAALPFAFLSVNGNALDIELLEEAGVSNAEAIIAVTDDDEVNVFSTLSGPFDFRRCRQGYSR